MDVTFEDILRQAEKAHIEHREDVQKLLKTAATTSNQTVLKSIHQRIQILATKKIEQPFPEPDPVIDARKNHVRLGKTPENRDVRIPADQLTKHMLITGQSGAGKTDEISSLMWQLQRLGIPWWAFDLKKDYRHLADDNRVNVIVIPSKKMRLNPLKPPPGVSPNLWANQVAKIFADSNRLLDASRLYLSAKISQLYIDNDVANGGKIPSFRELVHKVEQDKIRAGSKTRNYRDTVLNRLQGANSVIFDERTGYPLHELLEENVVFELKSLDQNLQNFVMELLQGWIYMYRDSLPPSERSNELEHVLIYDEGYRMYDENKEKQTKSVPAVNVMTAQLRDFSEGLIVATQVPSQLTDFITANTNTKLILPSVDRKQFDAIAASFDFDEYQEKEAWNLEVGEAVVMYGSNGPFKVSLPFFDLDKTVSDDDLVDKYSDRYQELLNADSLEHKLRAENTEDDTGFGPVDSEPDLSSEAVELLKDIAENPFRKTTERYERLESVSTGKAHNFKAELADNGLIRPTHVAAGNSVFKLFELTDEGREVVEKYGGRIYRKGRGGLKHRFYQHELKDQLEDDGAGVELEKEDADVYAEFDERVEVYEVAMSSDSREVDHVEKHLENDVDRVTVVCSNKQILDKLEPKLPDSDTVELTTISERF